MKLFFRGEIVTENGKKRLKILTETLYQRILNSMKEGEVSLSIEPKKKQRSISQNSFYWVYLGVIANEIGDNENDLHEYFKRALLPPKFVTVMGKEIRIPKSTTELSKAEFVEYMMKIEAMTGVPTPNPAEVGYISNNDIDYNKLK